MEASRLREKAVLCLRIARGCRGIIRVGCSSQTWPSVASVRQKKSNWKIILRKGTALHLRVLGDNYSPLWPASIVALGTVEVLLATGVTSKVHRQILVSFFKNGIVGRSRERHAYLGLMPQMRTLRPHYTHRVQLASFHNVRRFRAVCGSIFVAKGKESRCRRAI